jgi:hypothetical protein
MDIVKLKMSEPWAAREVAMTLMKVERKMNPINTQ